MKKIIVMGGSTSAHSINKQLAVYASEQLKDVDTLIVDLNEFEMPLFSVNLEKEIGFPKEAHNFIALFKNADGIIVSTSEHNRCLTAAFKNILDWCSRVELEFFNNLPTLLLSTSPGGFGGQNARNIAENMFTMFKADVVSKYALPKFHAHFAEGRIIDATLNTELIEAVQAFESKLN